MSPDDAMKQYQKNTQATKNSAPIVPAAVMLNTTQSELTQVVRSLDYQSRTTIENRKDGEYFREYLQEVAADVLPQLHETGVANGNSSAVHSIIAILANPKSHKRITANAKVLQRALQNGSLLSSRTEIVTEVTQFSPNTRHTLSFIHAQHEAVAIGHAAIARKRQWCEMHDSICTGNERGRNLTEMYHAFENMENVPTAKKAKTMLRFDSE